MGGGDEKDEKPWPVGQGPFRWHLSSLAVTHLILALGFLEALPHGSSLFLFKEEAKTQMGEGLPKHGQQVGQVLDPSWCPTGHARPVCEQPRLRAWTRCGSVLRSSSQLRPALCWDPGGALVLACRCQCTVVLPHPLCDLPLQGVLSDLLFEQRAHLLGFVFFPKRE